MGDSSFKNRNLLVLLFEILLIIVAIGGLTFATSRLMSGSTIVTFGEYNVDYVGKTEVSVDGLEPISDSLVNYNTYKNVIRLEFSLRGVKENEDDEEELIYDVMLNELGIDCSLMNEYTKWNLYKNGELLYSGNFDPRFDGNILTDNYRLTETQQDLPGYDDDYDKYVFIVWISEACEDLTNCDIKHDQSGIINSVINMKLFIALSGGEKVKYKRVANMDATCVNKPELVSSMIPVYYDGGNWRVADKTNSNVDKLWYNYGGSRWANVVIVNNDKYDKASAGVKVNSDDILAHYVWIPRFKYKLWNNGIDIDDSYNAYKNGIDIVFESGVNSSGNAICSNDKCVGSKNKYITHPAFGDDVRGFWISKYEISSSYKFISNVESLRNESLDSYKNIISNLTNTYNLDNVKSNIVSNLEWGAILYLSHSKYGVCVDNGCKEITSNNTFVSEYNKQDSTTRNVYGVYDMAGGSGEYAIGSSGLGSALNEVRIDGNETWYNGYYINNQKEYKIRGGASLFYTGDIGMFDVSTRGVLIVE